MDESQPTEVVPAATENAVAPQTLDHKMPASSDGDAAGFHFMLRALRYRNYRLFFFGQGVSLVGTWLTTTATAWLVLQLAKKSGGAVAEGTAQGLIRFAGQIPMF